MGAKGLQLLAGSAAAVDNMHTHTGILGHFTQRGRCMATIKGIRSFILAENLKWDIIRY